MTRVALPTPETIAPEDAWIFDKVRAQRPSPRIANIFKLLANVPAVLDTYLPMGSAVRQATGFDQPTTTLVILAVASARGSDYEYNLNWNAGLRAGLSREQVASVSTPEAACYSPEQADLIAFARAVAASGAVDDALFGRVHDRLGDSRTVALLMLIGWFTMNSCLTGPAALEMEADYQRA